MCTVEIGSKFSLLCCFVKTLDATIDYCQFRYWIFIQFSLNTDTKFLPSIADMLNCSAHSKDFEVEVRPQNSPSTERKSKELRSIVVIRVKSNNPVTEQTFATIFLSSNQNIVD